jgi:hypothetical protein
MTRVLDGYLMGRVMGWRGGVDNLLIYRIPGRIVALDGYLMGT